MKKLLYLLSFILLSGISCSKDAANPDQDNNENGEQGDQEISAAKQVSGSFSGTGKYMPGNIRIADTYGCEEPDWVSFLKTGAASCNITVINDSTVRVQLTGTVYSTGFSRDLVIQKTGDLISFGNIFSYDTNTKNLTIKQSSPVTSQGCNAPNTLIYYYVFIGPASSPPSPTYHYTSIERFEFSGQKN